MIRGEWRLERPTYRHGLETCGYFMPLAQAPCGRLKGHRYHHRTREAMDHETRVQLPLEPRIVLAYPGVKIILGPVPCKKCRHFVVYGHSGNSYREDMGPIWRGADGRKHYCPSPRRKIDGPLVAV